MSKKYAKDGCIVLQPLTIQWTEWRTRAQAIIQWPRDMKSVLRDLSEWQRQTDEWITSLSEQQKHDLLQLAGAEIDMLYCMVDQLIPEKYYESERLDFRTRFYHLTPLVATCERLQVYGVERVRAALNGLEDYATKRRQWLP
jgi:hypothetical protein